MKNFYEKELVCKLDRILKREFGTNLAFHEFSAGYGIADLVFATNFFFTKELVTRTPLTDFSSLNILLTLEEGKTYKLSKIVDIFSQITPKEIKRQLRTLSKNQYLKKLDKDTYCKPVLRNPLNPIKKIVAIEVKLNDHKNGFTQARRYQYFADKSYLAILKEAERNINFEEFNSHNIGLILFDIGTNTIEIKHPRLVNNHYENIVSLFAKEMMLSKFINFAS